MTGVTHARQIVASQFGRSAVLRSQNFEPKAFDQIAELAFEYQNRARSLRGIFEEMMTPILYVVPDSPDIEKVVVTSLFNEATLFRKQPAA